MRGPIPSRGGRQGFTLIEVLAVVFLTSLVLAVALDFYTDLSRASTRATDHTRELRQSTAVLDRMARDFQGAMLATVPEGEDPLYHGWRFVAEEGGGDEGADRVLFVTTNHRPRASDVHMSDYAVVAYLTRRAEDDTLDLLRWSAPHRPEAGGLEFPFEDDENLMLLAEGVDTFGVTFLSEAGDQKSSWDSASLVDSSQLPSAVEIALALVPYQRNGYDDIGGEAPPIRRRTVILPMPAVDLQALLDPLGAGGSDAGADGDEDGDGIPNSEDEDYAGPTDADTTPQTVGYCVTQAALGDISPSLLSIYTKNLHEPFRNFANVRLPDGSLLRDSPAVKDVCR